MEHFNLDVWTPDATTFRVKLVDFGADAAFGGGDDTEHELAFESLNLKRMEHASYSFSRFR